MKLLSCTTSFSVFAILAVAMVATRFHHLGSLLHLPDASMAAFFLGGLYLRRHLLFGLLLGLAVVVDWASVGYAGNSDFCITVAYAFLPAAYAALWYSGCWYASRLQTSALSLTLALGAALLGAVMSFAISNGAFYWLGGRYTEPHLAQYAARLWQWGPLFVRTTLTYVAAALAVHGLLAYVSRQRAACSTGA